MPCSECKLFTADLHIHSVLSPCAEREMLPACIILEALEKKIDIIAVCDHNAWENVGTVVSLGKRFGVWVIPGIEVETQEEIHLLCYFPTVSHLEKFSAALSDFLSRIPLREDLWGEEWVVEETGKIVEKKDYLLIHPVNLSVEKVINLVNFYEGVIVPAHVDRRSHSIFSQLGFIPPSLGVRVV
ncbi:MAG: PHP-associated domain-containing protein [Candidatus Caldatribacteriaceae bacterium]